MRNAVALIVLLMAATAMVCQSSDENADPGQHPSWTEWAIAKVTEAFKDNHAKETAQSDQAPSDAPSGSVDDMMEKAMEEEDAAAEAAKELSEKKHGRR